MTDLKRRPVRILLIEDSEVDAMLVSRLLANNPKVPFEVDLARRLGEALAKLQTTDYDLAMLDLVLPDAEGLESFEKIRALDARLPVVVLTGLEDEEMALQAIESGAQDFIAKGHITGQMLFRAVRFAIARQLKVMGIQAAADTDPLTGLPNRRHLEAEFTQALATSRQCGAPMSMALFDLDHFKRVNDQYGHFIGDAVLKEVGRQLAAAAMGEMKVARFGGEEFSLMMPGIALDEACEFTEAILQRLASKPLKFGDVEIKVTTSAGVTNVTEDDDWESAYVACDVALYEAKTSGRNRLVRRLRR